MNQMKWKMFQILLVTTSSLSLQYATRVSLNNDNLSWAVIFWSTTTNDRIFNEFWMICYDEYKLFINELHVKQYYS